MKILVDENIPLMTVQALREMDHEVLDIRGYSYLTVILLIDGLSGVGEEATLLASYLFDKELRIVGGMAGDDFGSFAPAKR